MASSRTESVDMNRTESNPPGIYRRMSSGSSDESGFNSDMSEDLSASCVSATSGSRTRYTCCVDTSHTNQPSYVKAVSHHLVAHIITCMAKPSDDAAHQPPCCSHVAILRRIVDDLSTRHKIIFESITKKLRNSRTVVNGHGYAEICQRTFSGVMDELFADGQYNWGRIATVFAFAGWWAKSGPCGTENDRFNADVWADTVTAVAGNYIAEKLCPWISQQGGWVTMDEFFAEPEPVETKMWRGLLYTMVGLGVVATVAAAVR